MVHKKKTRLLCSTSRHAGKQNSVVYTVNIYILPYVLYYYYLLKSGRGDGAILYWITTIVWAVLQYSGPPLYMYIATLSTGHSNINNAATS